MVQRWQTHAVKLPRALRELGVRIDTFSKDTPGASSRVEPVSDSVTMIFGVGSTWTFAASGTASLRSSAIFVGVSGCPHRVINEDRGTCLEVTLPPWLAAEIFTRDIVSSPSCLNIADEFGPLGRSLVEEVTNSPDLRFASEAVIRFLCHKLKNKTRSTRSEILWAWEQLSNTCSETTIKALANDLGWSERHFSSRYSQATGCTPTRSAKLARFSLAYQTMMDQAMSISDVAVLAGYYDQSHMYRDFRKYSGLTPRQVRQQEAQHLIIDR